jgi:DNA polymerase-3 subunit delta
LPESTEKPVVYLLHGDDPVEAEKFIAAMIARMGDPSLLELNLSRLDARSSSDSDLRTAALAMPFLADRRLVILEQAQTRLGKTQKDKIEPFLSHLPDSTALVLIVIDEFVTGGSKRGWQLFAQDHWIWPWIKTMEAKVHYHACRQPLLEDMPDWIRKKAEGLGGKFEPAAARVLSDHTGSDTQYALQEITKLLTYVDFKRPVDPDDVELLTAPGGQVNVFDMVDALAEGNSNRALRLLKGLQDETDSYSLFGMVIRQFRLMIQAREVLDEGGSTETIMRELGVVKFVAQKLTGQAAGFSMGRLRQVYHRLLELDEGTKTSQWTPELALELFVAEMKS